MRVQTVDRDAVISAIEMLAHEAEASDVNAVRNHCTRLIEDPRAVRAKLVKEEVAAAVACDACIELMCQKNPAPESHVVDVEP